MNLSELSLKALVDHVIGENPPSPYRTGPQLVDLFNLSGLNDTYPFDFSRREYALDRLIQINDSEQLHCLIELLIDSRIVGRENVENIAKNISEIIIHDGYEFESINGSFTLTGGNLNDPLTINTRFKDIRAQILKSIAEAEYFIWVAVAWFTDNEIARCLDQRASDGLSVIVLVNDDDLSKSRGVKFGAGVECHKIRPVTPKGDNTMHNKFMIIDMRTVSHGSYNFTNTAPYNNETYTIVEGRKNAEKFAKEFVKLMRRARSLAL
jgi:hypothetical protein